MDTGVIDNPDQSRFELRVGGALATATYRIEGHRVILIHTEVPPELSGQGIGSRLAQGVFQSLRESGRKVVVECPFMAAWASRHAEHADLADGPERNS